jgi:hypothetical protein
MADEDAEHEVDNGEEEEEEEDDAQSTATSHAFEAPRAESGVIDESPAVSAVVPRLDDLVVNAIADNYDIYPCLDRIPHEYVENVVALLDPAQIEFAVAAKYITTEKFWKRLAQERWPICQLDKHGLSWKRLYIERHLQALIEAYYPSNSGHNFEKLMKEINAGKSYVHSINVQQLLSHVDLSDVLIEFPNLTTLTLKYGARKIGMDYGTFVCNCVSASNMSSHRIK